MIIETLIIGSSVSFISYLIFLNAKIKREREWELEDNAYYPIIEPFMVISVGTPCPKCLRPSTNAVYNKTGVMIAKAEGMYVPTACIGSSCEAHDYSHLHVKCSTCLSTWFIETADSKSDDDEDEEDEEDEVKKDDTLIH